MPIPFISFVVAARNDNYGGGFLYRIQVFVNALLALCQKHHLEAELVIVEWNPPQDRPRLKDAISWPRSSEWPLAIRIIEVPAALHNQLPNADKMPMFEYIAKNVGIRRARGEYILATNADIIFSSSLIEFLSKRKLSKDCFYRIDRYDVNIQNAPDDIAQLERICEANWLYVCKLIDRFPRDEYYKPKLKKVLNCLIHPLALRGRLLMIHKAKRMSAGLHLNAPGDFFLMANNWWHRLKGYPEFKTHSFIDGYICFLAASSGLRQVILKEPLRIYHQEHDRSESGGRPKTDRELYSRRGRMMLKSKAPEIINGESWGFAGEKLSEYALSI